MSDEARPIIARVTTLSPLRNPDQPYDVLIIGAGFAGIGAAAQLRRAGITDIAILERAGDVGGVWRDNTYPGCRCDVPSSLYSFSYLPNSGWPDRFASQPEIHAYLRDAVQDLGLSDYLHVDSDVTNATWQPDNQVWFLRLATGQQTSARMLVVGSGAMNEPAIPRIPGLNEFTGEVFHSARWPREFDPTGRRIAVVGTGASAVQLVPQVAAAAGNVVVFQRTAPWVLPRGDRSIPAWARQLHKRMPATMQAVRGTDFMRRELMTNSFTKSGRFLSLIEAAGQRHIARQVKDQQLRDAVTPDFRPGCKRLLMSDDWYPTLQKDNVELVTDRIDRFIAKGAAMASGAVHEFDTLILATGFHVQRRSILSMIIGDGGESMAATMVKGYPTAYLGSTLPGFPNLILMTGPNTGLANNSMLLMIEAQARYAASMAGYLAQNPTVALDVKPTVFAAFASELEKRLTRTVWSSGGCASWYQDATGRVTALWPGTTTEFRRRTNKLTIADYRIVPRPS